MFRPRYGPVQARRRTAGYATRVVDRRDVASWLDGPRARTQRAGEYAGQDLGLPESGPGSIARFGRRLVAVAIDWAICQLIAVGLLHAPLGEGGGGSFVPLLVFAVENLVLLATLGSTVGHRLVGIGLMSADGRRAGLVQVALRTFLLCLAVPALIWDRDGRGMHDRLASTLLVRR